VYANVQYAVYTQNYASLSASAGASASAKTNAAGNNKRLELSPQLLQLAQMLDRLAIMGCLVFGELPAHNKVRFRFVVTKMFFVVSSAVLGPCNCCFESRRCGTTGGSSNESHTFPSNGVVFAPVGRCANLRGSGSACCGAAVLL
jgi:hypothetical protein